MALPWLDAALRAHEEQNRNEKPPEDTGTRKTEKDDAPPTDRSGSR